MANTASNFVKQAKAWKGCKESDGTHKKIIDVYNARKPLPREYKVKYNDAWCATYVSAVAIKSGCEDIIPIECSCNKMIEIAKAKGIFVENENRKPNVGDICFYDWDDNGKGDCKGGSEHVGIVVDVSRETFTVIEGNYSNRVKERSLAINGRYIRGFAVPKFKKEVSKPSNTSKPSEWVEALAREVIAGKWGNGSERYERINEAIQNRVNEILKG